VATKQGRAARGRRVTCPLCPYDNMLRDVLCYFSVRPVIHAVTQRFASKCGYQDVSRYAGTC
jgi:hypothetical protein